MIEKDSKQYEEIITKVQVYLFIFIQNTLQSLLVSSFYFLVTTYPIVSSNSSSPLDPSSS
jgi:hypothetical protein